MSEPEPTAARLVPMPRNPDGSVPGVGGVHGGAGEAAEEGSAEDFDPRREMLARLNRMDEILSKD